LKGIVNRNICYDYMVMLKAVISWKQPGEFPRYIKKKQLQMFKYDILCILIFIFKVKSHRQWIVYVMIQVVTT